jgi:hypothetical protein
MLDDKKVLAQRIRAELEAGEYNTVSLQNYPEPSEEGGSEDSSEQGSSEE